MSWPVLPHGFLGQSGDQDTYRIERSLRFNSADSAYLSRTPASAGNRQIATYSFWVKRTVLGSVNSYIFDEGNWNGASGELPIQFSNDFLTIHQWNGSGLDWQITTSQVFRDVASWGHIVISIDTTQSTASNRVKIYFNGSQITNLSTANYPTQNSNTGINTNVSKSIGRWQNGAARYFDGYLTEINFIDGQALTPSSFGETDAITGRWKAKAFTGSYGTNGFYLNFSDNSNTTASTLGKDSSPNGNNWTPNNFSVTAGAGNDSLVDSPTNYGTDSGVGGQVRGNYATLNALDNGGLTLANGNLDSSRATASWASIRSSVGMSSGKWYWEVTPTSGLSVGSTTNQTMIGISKQSATLGGFYQSSDGWGYYYNDGNKWNNNSGSSYGSTYTNNDVIGVAFDADNGTLVFYKNNVSQGTAFSGLTNGPYFPTHGLFGTTSSVINFGQRPFAYTAPSGFKALCTTNLPTPSIQKPSTAMDVVTYTGDGTSSKSITGVGFQPDLIWIKNRTNAYNHTVVDSIRGGSLYLETNNTNADQSATVVSSFNSDGFQIGTSSIQVNGTSNTYVAWAWDAGSSNVTNTAGSITSTVRADATKGFSIVNYNGTGANATVGHGLGVAPKMVIVKSRGLGGANYGWPVWHTALTGLEYLVLNATSAKASAAVVWNSTTPSSTVFSLGTDVSLNQSTNTYIAYCFSEIEGYSRFGSYTGNGSSDGPFVWCGFRPKFVMIKRTDAAGEIWQIQDSVRSVSNPAQNNLFPNLSQAEQIGGADRDIDIISSGFKWRGTNTGTNASGGTYIFAAFAEAPFKYARAR